MIRPSPTCSSPLAGSISAIHSTFIHALLTQGTSNGAPRRSDPKLADVALAGGVPTGAVSNVLNRPHVVEQTHVTTWWQPSNVSATCGERLSHAFRGSCPAQAAPNS